MSRTVLLPVLVVLLMVCGCGKEPTPSAAQPGKPSAVPQQVAISATPTPAASPQPAPASPGALLPVSAPKTQTETPDRVQMRLDRLAEAIRTFRKDNERYPTGIQELIKSGYISKVPPAPPGKRYEIDSKTGAVSLLNE